MTRHDDPAKYFPRSLALYLDQTSYLEARLKNHTLQLFRYQQLALSLQAYREHFRVAGLTQPNLHPDSCLRV